MKDDFLYASDADHEQIKKIQDGVLRNQKRDNFIHADLIRAENIVFLGLPLLCTCIHYGS